MGEIQIRLAVESDIARMQEVEQRAAELFAETPFSNIVTMPGTSTEFFIEQIAVDQVWVAIVDEPVGFAIATLVDDSAHLQELSVDPQFGRRGIGTRLVETVIDWAACNGDPSVTLTTFRDIPWNGPYYRKLGFSVLDETELTDAMRAVRIHEEEIGLQIAQRDFMRRQL